MTPCSSACDSRLGLAFSGIRLGCPGAMEPIVGGMGPFSSSSLCSHRGSVTWVPATVLPASIYLFDQCGMPEFFILNCRTVVALPTESALALQTPTCKTPFPSLSFPTCKGGKGPPKLHGPIPHSVSKHRCLQCGERVKYTPGFKDSVGE